MKLVVGKGIEREEFTKIEIEDYDGNTIFEVDLADYDFADTEDYGKGVVARIQQIERKENENCRKLC